MVIDTDNRASKQRFCDNRAAWSEGSRRVKSHRGNEYNVKRDVKRRGNAGDEVLLRGGLSPEKNCYRRGNLHDKQKHPRLSSEAIPPARG